jgi:hypothetical protein
MTVCTCVHLKKRVCTGRALGAILRVGAARGSEDFLPPTWEVIGGASWNRTSDLSIISAAL